MEILRMFKDFFLERTDSDNFALSQIGLLELLSNVSSTTAVDVFKGSVIPVRILTV